MRELLSVVEAAALLEEILLRLDPIAPTGRPVWRAANAADELHLSRGGPLGKAAVRETGMVAGSYPYLSRRALVAAQDVESGTQRDGSFHIGSRGAPAQV